VNPNSFDVVDRVMVFRINIDEDQGVSVEPLLDCSAVDFEEKFKKSSGKLIFDTNQTGRKEMPIGRLAITDKAEYQKYRIVQYENGTIKVLINGQVQDVTLPELRKIATILGVDKLNGVGNDKNTRTLGADIISKIHSMNGS